MMKKIKKSTWVSAALLLYVSAMAVYFLPRNMEMSIAEKYITTGTAYGIVLVLWMVLRKKERLQQKRLREQERQK